MVLNYESLPECQDDKKKANVIAHLHSLIMDLRVGRAVGPTVDSTVG